MISIVKSETWYQFNSVQRRETRLEVGKEKKILVEINGIVFFLICCLILFFSYTGGGGNVGTWWLKNELMINLILEKCSATKTRWTQVMLRCHLNNVIYISALWPQTKYYCIQSNALYTSSGFPWTTLRKTELVYVRRRTKVNNCVV